jgi:hypothetical protein
MNTQMRFKKFVAILSLALCLTVSIRAGQQDYRTAAIKTESGALLVWNQPDNYFTLEIKGQDVRPNNSTSDIFFKVDGLIIQVQVAAISQFVKDSNKESQTAQAILAAHRDWEAGYAGGIFHKKLDVQSSPLKLKSGSDALFWKFEMPKGFNQEAKKQLYVTVINNGYVIVLNGVVTEQTKEEDVKQLLLRIMETLKVSLTPFNLQELQENIRRGNSQ